MCLISTTSAIAQNKVETQKFTHLRQAYCAAALASRMAKHTINYTRAV